MRGWFVIINFFVELTPFASRSYAIVRLSVCLFVSLSRTYFYLLSVIFGPRKVYTLLVFFGFLFVIALTAGSKFKNGDEHSAHQSQSCERMLLTIGDLWGV